MEHNCKRRLVALPITRRVRTQYGGGIKYADIDQLGVIRRVPIRDMSARLVTALRIDAPGALGAPSGLASLVIRRGGRGFARRAAPLVGVSFIPNGSGALSTACQSTWCVLVRVSWPDSSATDPFRPAPPARRPSRTASVSRQRTAAARECCWSRDQRPALPSGTAAT